MHHPSIRLEGSLLSADILDAVERGDKPFQTGKDFGLDQSTKVKDEIAEAWAAARAYWTAFQSKVERLKEGATGTTETRNLWMVPFFGLLGYQLQLAESEVIQDKTYRISHRDPTRDNLPVHITGCFESLDRRSSVPNAPRVSPHGFVQEYINLTEHLYGVVSNGKLLRLLRDSSRLVKLTFIEFDLERIFTEEQFADFALLYRLVHASRLPSKQSDASESPIEVYHQDSLDSGSRIRDGLSHAVRNVMILIGNGFLKHPDNTRLRELAAADPSGAFAMDYYAHLLRLVYRMLFLMVIEERGLVHPPGTDRRLKEIYADGYSISRLRRLSEKPQFFDDRYHDAWLSLIALFRLVDESGRGRQLGVAPLGGDLFGSGSLAMFEGCLLDNATFLGALRQLTLFANPVNRQLMRVNYGALNVEEFGSVYQGLLEFKPQLGRIDQSWQFAFAQGDDRATTGSHYTPDELVQPLIKHSLAHLIEEKLKDPNPEEALLSLRVADISCGSGHILLAAARRIATELAVVRTGEEQPSPAAYRSALRDVIRTCIYGVDLNPLAVELCKVALWLEAHSPGEPINFLDHHIKCGNAIVGFAWREELERGVPEEAFKTLAGDDKDIAAAFRKANKAERAFRKAGQQSLSEKVIGRLGTLSAEIDELSQLPEHTPEEIDLKKARYEKFQNSDGQILRQLAAIPIAQFYHPKIAGNKGALVTEASFRAYLEGSPLDSPDAAAAWETATRKRFFHWFIEFPEIAQRGGFDCILGNPPYLGGQALSGSYGHSFCEYVRWQFAPTGLSELVVFFLRRIYSLLRPNGFTAFITTNSIKDGDVRKDGLEQIIAAGAAINMAVRGIKWPGVANLVVSLVSIHKGPWKQDSWLDGKSVPLISAFFEDSADAGEPIDLAENSAKVFQGSIFLGDGFLLTHDEAESLKHTNAKNQEVIFPLINGQELNNNPDQLPGRSIINFRDWPQEKARKYEVPFSIVETQVKPERLAQKDAGGKEFWWRFLRPRMEMYTKISTIPRCFAAARTTKHLNFSACPTNLVFSDALYVFTTDRWDQYALVQSTIHEVWARKYSGALETRLRYSPSDCFETFAFPAGQWQTPNSALAGIGERYHEHRRKLMLSLWLGLTDIYNLFHSREAEKHLGKLFANRAKKHFQGLSIPQQHRADVLSFTPEKALAGILDLRRLHVELDQCVRDAYGWNDLPLEHDFYEVETLPENDRIRYTISTTARKELLKRLLAENHARAAAQQAGRTSNKTKGPKPQREKRDDELI
jgi:methylase of polypeptide subunit release factors